MKNHANPTSPQHEQPEPQPPRWADRLLEWFVAPHLLEYVQGDLHEVFTKRVKQAGTKRARWEYIWAVLQCLTPYFSKRKPQQYFNPNPTDMLQNYLISSYRGLLKNKQYTFINLAGLAVGISSLLLIALYVASELSYDRFHANADRIYRLYYQVGKPGEAVEFPVLGAGVAGQLKREFGEIQAATRVRYTGSPLVSYGSNTFKEEAFAYVDANFFQVFSLSFVAGNPTTALTKPNSVVITEQVAQKYFGQEDPVGKSLQFKAWNTFYQVTGVIKSLPANAHFHFDFFASMASLAEAEDNRWIANTSFYTYLLLPKVYDYQKLEAKLPLATEKYLGPEIASSWGKSYQELKRTGDLLGIKLEPLTDIHLHSHKTMEIEPNGDIRYVYIFSAVGLFVLIVASINFVNLSTASAARRAKEVGVRKVLGSMKGQLVSQFLTDSFLLTFLAVLLSLALVWLSLPLVNQLAGKALSVHLLFAPKSLLAIVGLGVGVALLAGSYPAFYLSSIKPIQALKGRIGSTSHGVSLRSGLVVFQFFVAITLTVATLVVHRQLDYMQSKKLGFQKDQVLLVSNTYTLKSNEQVFKEQVLQLPGVASAAVSGYLPINSPNDSNGGLASEGANGVKIGVRVYRVDEDYLPTMGMALAQGRNFSREYATDSSSVILNEAAIRKLGYEKNPIGRKVYGDAENGKRVAYTVVGVVRNFHFQSLHQPIEPLVMFLGHNSGALLVKVQSKDVKALLTSMEQQWKKLAPDTPFSYQFLNQRFDKVYQAEQKTGELLTAFAGVTIFVACLGLFGLAAFITAQRTKEIGVRKVLGATLASIILLLSKEFIKLVAVALLLAAPLSVYLMQGWLENFAYRIQVEWWVVALAGVLALPIALLSVGYHTLKAAFTNPVKSLRSE
jgi:putative ABC transport system permease protein